MHLRTLHPKVIAIVLVVKRCFRGRRHKKTCPKTGPFGDLKQVFPSFSFLVKSLLDFDIELSRNFSLKKVCSEAFRGRFSTHFKIPNGNASF